MPSVTSTWKSLVIGADGIAVLVRSPNARKKRAAGKCVTKRCRSWLPESALSKGNCHCSKCAMRRWRVNYPVRSVLAMLRERSRRKHIPFDLTITYLRDLLQESGYLERRGRSSGSLHIDRVIPKLGYVQGNIRVITCSENVAKGNVERWEIDEPF